jgi:hypothetical protein
MNIISLSRPEANNQSVDNNDAELVQIITTKPCGHFINDYLTIPSYDALKSN